MRQFWQEILFPLLWRPHLGNLKKSGLRDPGNLTFQLRKAETLSLWKIPSGAWVISHFNRVWLFGIPWTVAHQAPLPMGFCRQEYWSRVPGAPPGDLPDPEIKLEYLYICIGRQVHDLRLMLPGKSIYIYIKSQKIGVWVFWAWTACSPCLVLQ